MLSPRSNQARACISPGVGTLRHVGKEKARTYRALSLARRDELTRDGRPERARCQPWRPSRTGTWCAGIGSELRVEAPACSCSSTPRRPMPIPTERLATPQALARYSRALIPVSRLCVGVTGCHASRAGAPAAGPSPTSAALSADRPTPGSTCPRPSKPATDDAVRGKHRSRPCARALLSARTCAVVADQLLSFRGPSLLSLV